MQKGNTMKPAQFETQEPVACIEDGDLYFANEIDWQTLQQQGIAVQLLYTAPPQRTWVGLTNGEFVEACQMAERGNYLVAFVTIQAKLKEKNHDTEHN